MSKADQPTSTIALGLKRRASLDGGCTASPIHTIQVVARLFLEGGAHV